MLGEVSFDALSARWTMFLGNAAQCALEEHFDKGFFAILADSMPDLTVDQLSDPAAMMRAARNVRITTLRDLAWFALQKHHPDIDVTEVSDLIDAVGSEAFGSLLARAIAGAQDKGGSPSGTGKKPVRPARKTRAKGPTGSG